MEFIDLSQQQDVGSTCCCIQLGPFRLAVDAGIHPKEIGNAAIPDLKKIPPFSLDAILLTHCHLDHSGALPILKRQQIQAPILATHSSCFLAPRMLRNSFKVMLRQQEEKGIAEYPLYSSKDIASVERDLVPIPFNQKKTLEKHGELLHITAFPAGHIPGAAGFLLEYKNRTIFFTGDVLFQDQKIVPGAVFPNIKLDTLIIETTRGAYERPADITRETETNRLIRTIENTIAHGGTCLLPVFALGRMHEMLSILQCAREDGKLKKVPIFCSGLGLDLAEYLDHLTKKTKWVRFRKKTLKQLGVKVFQQTVTPGANDQYPGIYVISSGMLIENTPAYRLAASMLEDPHNSICFVGYADPDTPAGKLLASAHESTFVFDALHYKAKVRAHIERFDFSGHADRDELFDYIQATDPRAVILTHGDRDARAWFESTLFEKMPKMQVFNPEPRKQYWV